MEAKKAFEPHTNGTESIKPVEFAGTNIAFDHDTESNGAAVQQVSIEIEPEVPPAAAATSGDVLGDPFCATYWRKWFRIPTLFPVKPRPSLRANWQPSIWSFIGAFLGMLGLATIHFLVLIPRKEELQLNLISFSFAATAVLVYDVPESPLAQPRNVIGGHVLSALVGLTLRQFLWDYPYISGPLAVALSISLMRLTNTTHPPGGATALMAAVSFDIPTGPTAYWALLSPFLVGALWLVLIAIIVNNFSRARQYPVYWF